MSKPMRLGEDFPFAMMPSNLPNAFAMKIESNIRKNILPSAGEAKLQSSKN